MRWQLESSKLPRACKVRLPQDLAVIGFDDIPAAKLNTPPLTTMHQPMAEKGRLAVAALLKEDGPLRIMVPTKLIIRQSSDPATLGSGQETEVEVRAHSRSRFEATQEK
jgi:Periplasmic binding protein-like domain